MNKRKVVGIAAALLIGCATITTAVWASSASQTPPASPDIAEAQPKQKGGLHIGIGGDFGKAGVDVNALAAEVLGINSEDVLSKLAENGGDLKALLDEAGKLDEFKALVAAKLRESFADAIASGKLTEEQAQTFISSAVNRLFDASARFKRGLPDIARDGLPALDAPSVKQRGTFGFDVAAILGISEDELAALIEANGGSLRDAIVNSGGADKFKEGALSQYSDKLDAFLNGDDAAFGGFHTGGRGGSFKLQDFGDLPGIEPPAAPMTTGSKSL